MRNVSRDQRIDQSATSIQSLLNTNGATFLMTSPVRLALWTLLHLLKVSLVRLVELRIWSQKFKTENSLYTGPPLIYHPSHNLRQLWRQAWYQLNCSLQLVPHLSELPEILWWVVNQRKTCKYRISCF